MQGGTISRGRLATLGVRGSYWISCISSFSKITWPALVAMFLPTSKTLSSVMEIRPFSMSAIRFWMPAVMLWPLLSTACLMNSGLVAAKLAGERASMYWRAMKRRRFLALSSSSGTASTTWRRKLELSR